MEIVRLEGDCYVRYDKNRISKNETVQYPAGRNDRHVVFAAAAAFFTGCHVSGVPKSAF